MLTARFLYFFPLCLIISVTLVEATDLIEKEVRLLDRIDNSQVVQSLIVNVDQVLNDYINDQVSVESQHVRAIIWNKLPSDSALEHYFNANFKVIKYDATYRDFKDKKMDYTQYHTLKNGRTWEKFVYIRVQNESITLFFSYTIKWSIWDYLPFVKSYRSAAPAIEKFFSEASVRMFNKLTHPSKSVYSHGLSLVDDEGSVRYTLVYHDNRNGYIEEIVPSFEDGLRRQEYLDQQKLSSCIMVIKDGQKSLRSIRHPIVHGHIVPDFHAYYGILIPKKQSAIHQDL